MQLSLSLLQTDEMLSSILISRQFGMSIIPDPHYDKNVKDIINIIAITYAEMMVGNRAYYITKFYLPLACIYQITKFDLPF